MSAEAPSRREQMVLDFIRERVSAGGFPPTIREIMAAMGTKSTNWPVQILRALAKKGYIQRDFNHARSIRLLKVPLSEAQLLRRWYESEYVRLHTVDDRLPMARDMPEIATLRTLFPETT